MSFDTVMFIPADGTFTEREKQMIRRSGRDPLFIVMGSEEKARSLCDNVENSGMRDVTVISMHNPDSRYLLPYLAGTVDDGAVIDVTFASSYYASSVTLLTRNKGVDITYTQWDGSVSVIHRHDPLPSTMDDQSRSIVDCLIPGPRTLSELEKELGMNYKTLARRASYLLRDGRISKTDDYPIRYYLTEQQEADHNLSSCSDREKVVGGRVFISAMQALLAENTVFMGTVRIDG